VTVTNCQQFPIFNFKGTVPVMLPYLGSMLNNAYIITLMIHIETLDKIFSVENKSNSTDTG